MTDNNEQVHLVLFDLDGTLVDIMAAHLASIEIVSKQVWGIKGFPPNVSVQGKPQLQFLRESCRAQGVSEKVIESTMPHAARLLADATIARLPEPIESAVLPGVFDLLDEFVARGIPRALVTGTLRRTAHAVLARTGLAAYFPVRVMGDLARQRRELVHDAIQRAQVEYAIEVSDHQITAIGDSPMDIQTAHHLGIRAVGVATGFNSLEELRQYNPEGLLQDLSDLPAAFEALLGTPPQLSS